MFPTGARRRFWALLPDEPSGELPIESGKVVGEMLVGLSEAIPQGAVEALVSPFSPPA